MHDHPKSSEDFAFSLFQIVPGNIETMIMREVFRNIGSKGMNGKTDDWPVEYADCTSGTDQLTESNLLISPLTI